MAKADFARLIEICSGSGLTLSTAESCTGGYLGSSIVEIPGASVCYLGGVIAYSDKAKFDLLGVSESSCREHGSVSRVVALEMAQGCLGRFRSDIAVSLTGIAGPGGGSLDKPVGTVFIAITGGKVPPICEGFHLGNIGRPNFKKEAVRRALGMMMGRARTIIERGERHGDGLSA